MSGGKKYSSVNEYIFLFHFLTIVFKGEERLNSKENPETIYADQQYKSFTALQNFIFWLPESKRIPADASCKDDIVNHRIPVCRSIYFLS